jgi:Kef-type K+ transport system membrane component KefB
MSFNGLLLVTLIAFLVPLVLGFFPKVRLPAIVLEILAGIAIGPAGLGWVTIDPPIQVLSILGLSVLLFLAGLELDVSLLRGRRLKATLLGWLLSFAIAYAVSLALHAAGMVQSSLLVGIILSATALGVVVPVLKDANELEGNFGQLIVAASSIAEFGTIILLSLLFSREVTDPLTKGLLMGSFVVLTLIVVGAVVAAEHSRRLGSVLLQLQDSTAQIRVRGAAFMLVAFAALAERMGLEVILGAFVAGALLSLLDKDYQKTHPKFHEKLEAIGFGVFIPVFFVASGIKFDLHALFADAGTIVRVPIFLIALLLARGVPALLYVPLVGRPRAIVAGLLQATSLPFIVAATSIGVELGVLTKTNAAGLIAAGLLSVIIFPMTALAMLRGAPPAPAVAAERT